jgi:hypothetical protein
VAVRGLPYPCGRGGALVAVSVPPAPAVAVAVEAAAAAGAAHYASRLERHPALSAVSGQ